MPFVPLQFEVPTRLVTSSFVLEPLGPEHNEADYDAWTSSLAHIHRTPGFEGRDWPHELSLEENLGDLERHARDFADRLGFTYTVRDAAGGAVIGCVYIYPATDSTHDAIVRSWVRESRAELDGPLARAVSDWLAGAWPFERIDHAPRLE
jgi:RimJ/RimL family protein N-acetyltransferase